MTATRRPPVTVAREIRIRVWQCECATALQARTHYWSKKRCETCGTERPDMQPAKQAHVPGIEQQQGKYPVRAACSCGWRGIWKATEGQTRNSAKAHAEAYR